MASSVLEEPQLTDETTYQPSTNAFRFRNSLDVVNQQHRRRLCCQEVSFPRQSHADPALRTHTAADVSRCSLAGND